MSLPTRFASTAIATLLLAFPASAEWLANDSAIRSLVSGKRVYLKVPLGGEFPLHYRQDGSVTGDGSALGLGKYLTPRETGRWWVESGKLCQKFPTWYKSKTNCFRLQPTGEANLRWQRDDGYSGRARVAR